MSGRSVLYVDGLRTGSDPNHTIGPVKLKCPSAGPPLGNKWAYCLFYQKAELVGEALCGLFGVEQGRLLKLSYPYYMVPGKALYWGVSDGEEHFIEIEGTVDGNPQNIGKPMLIKNLFTRQYKDVAKVDEPNPFSMYVTSCSELTVGDPTLSCQCVEHANARVPLVWQLPDMMFSVLASVAVPEGTA